MMKYRSIRNTAIAIALAVFLAALAAGCSQNDTDKSSLGAGIQQQSQQLQAIASRTGGDWNKLTPSDKQVLVQQIAHGNEHNARMLLMTNTPGGMQMPNRLGQNHQNRPSVPPG